MQIIYCDTCGCPIKNRRFVLMTAEYRDTFNDENYGNSYNKGFVKETTKEICEICHTIIGQLLEHRMISLLRLSEDCRTLYEIPAKEHKRRKKDTK